MDSTAQTQPLAALQAPVEKAYFSRGGGWGGGSFQQIGLVGETRVHAATRLSFVPSCAASPVSILVLSASYPALPLREAARPGGLGPSLLVLCAQLPVQALTLLLLGPLAPHGSSRPAQVSPSTRLTIHCPAQSFPDGPGAPGESSGLCLSVRCCPAALLLHPQPFLRRNSLLLSAGPLASPDVSLGSSAPYIPVRHALSRASGLSRDPL